MEQALAKNAACIHCGTFFTSSSSQRFCCAGCEFVFSLIQDKGLGRFYELRDANPPVCPAPVETSKSTFDYCDDPEFIRRSSPDGRHLNFYLEGLNCTACLWLLEKLPDFCPDAETARINMSSSTIEVARTPGGSFAKIAQTLNRYGYRPHPIIETHESKQFQVREKRGDLIRIGVAGAATGNIMILAVSIYAGATGNLANEFRWLSALLALPVLTYCAWPFYRSALFSLKTKHINLDVPIVAALLAGITMSAWSLLRSENNVYFDSLSMLVFLLLSSRLVLKSVQNKQLGATNLESEFLLATVERVPIFGAPTLVSSLKLEIGDVIRVAAGQIVPVDGIVISGSGLISAAVLTGESEPISISEGSKIEAGVESLSDSWLMKVERLSSQTRIAKIFRDTEKAAIEKSDFVRASDKAAQWFIGIVFLTAALVVGYFWTSNLHEGISRALALIIVTCPCVFGIAIPLSMSLAVRKAAAHGIIIKDSGTVERLWKINSLLFDKTGTLTTGQMSLLNLRYENGSDLEIAMGLEQGQKHPVARAIVASMRELGVTPRNFANVAELSTGGVIGELNGAFYSVKPLIPDNSNSGEVIRSSFGLFRDDEVLLSFDLGDQPRKEAVPMLQWARQNFSSVRLISGDRGGVVTKCADLLGFNTDECESEKTPEEKAVAVRKIGSGIAMIGDGANDAAALAAADVGIAVCGSLDVSLRAADVYLTKQTLTAIPRLFKIAELTRSAIYRNLVFSVSFNVVSGFLAVSGAMSPLWAAVLMPISSLTVLLSATWTGRKISEIEGLA